MIGLHHIQKWTAHAVRFTGGKIRLLLKYSLVCMSVGVFCV